MTPSDIDQAAPTEIAAMAGLAPIGRQRGRWLYCGPCPVCGKTLAHERSEDRRGAIAIGAGFKCWGNGCVTGSRLDLIALARHQQRWADLDRDERDAILGAPAPAPATLPPPPPRLDPETWARLAALCVSPRYDGRLNGREQRIFDRTLDWFQRRKLVPAEDLLVIVGEPNPDLPALWTAPREDRAPFWLPDLGASLLLPCFDERGQVAGARIRSVRPDPKVKEQALRGFSAAGLAYVPRGLRERWQAGEASDRPVALAEGKPDQLALGWAWRGQAWVIGYFEGSLGGIWAHVHRVDIHVHQEDAPDRDGRRKSDTYRRQVIERWPEVREIGVSQLFGLAGIGWEEGDDVADLAGDVPALNML